MALTIRNNLSVALVVPHPISVQLGANEARSFNTIEFDSVINDATYISLIDRGIVTLTNDEEPFEDFPEKAMANAADLVLIEDSADDYAKKKIQVGNLTAIVDHADTHKGGGTDEIDSATQTVAGLMSATDKVVLDDVAAGIFLTAVRNETGAPIAKGTLVASAGWSTFHNTTLIIAADKDNLTRQPVIGAVYATIPNDTAGQVIVSGPLEDVDTSLYNPNDILVLGNAGAFSLAPPTASPFTGEIHVVGIVLRVSGPNGIIQMLAPLPSMVDGPEVFALAGTTGTPGPANKFVTDTDPRLIDPPNYFTVAATGADYTSVKSAIDAAVAAGATPANPYGIRIYPGTYTESPMTIPPGVIVSALFANRTDTVYIVAANPAQDLFTMTGGYIIGLMAMGVADATKACFRIAGAGVLATLHGGAVRNCSNGAIVSGGAACIFTNFSISILGAGQGVTTGIQCTGAGSYVGLAGGFFSVPAAALPAYPGVDPIATCIKVQDSATAFFSGISARVAYNTAAADVLFADTGATATLAAGDVQGCNNAVHIGAAGANTYVTTIASTVNNNVLNAKIDSATGVVFLNIAADTQRYSGVPGAREVGIVQYRDDNTTRFSGDLQYRFYTGKDADLADFIADGTSTGVCGGGVVTDAGGLDVSVAAGDAWIQRTVEEDAFWVEWNTVTITLANNSTVFVYYDSVTSAVTSGPAAPGDEGVLLATAITTAGDIRYLHRTRVPIDSIQERISTYLTETRKHMSRSGLAVTAGSTARRIDVDPGSYYLGLDIISYAGALDAPFSSFYGTDGASETAGVVNIDITNYDNAGALAALGGGHFRSDTLHVSSDGRLAVIYGRVDHALEADAVTEPSVTPPTFIEPSSFPLAKLIVKEAVGITQIIDIRPTTATAAGAGGTVASHSALADLLVDSHSQYLPISGARAMTGALDMGANIITNVGTVDGVDVSAHAVRHNPGGVDTLTIGVPVDAQIGGVSADGVAASFARSDHLHIIPTAAPLTIGTANDVGAASSGSRSDHVHSHGNQTVATLHAVAVAGVSAGFISVANEAVLEDLAAGHTLITARNETGAPIPRNTLVASAGWSVVHDCTLLVVADKDDGDKRPAIGVIHRAAIPDSANGQVLISGVIESIDTSTWNVTDQLVLGTAGAFSRPPPDVDPFTGEVQNVGSVVRVNAVDGKVLFIPDGMNAVDAQQIFALAGTNGSPSKTNKYVTDSDPRNSNSRTPTAHAVSHTDGTDQIANVTVLASGFMSAADKTKLNGVTTGATNTPLSAVAPVDVAKTLASQGISTSAARSDHQHSISTATAVDITTTSAEGDSSTLARANHTHAGLTRGAADFAAFAIKAVPSTSDVLLIEDAAAAGAKKYVTAGTLPGPATTSAEATGSTTTTSATDTLTTAMTVTPAAGKYLVTYSGSIANGTNGQSTYVSIWYNGAQIGSSERRLTRGNQNISVPFCCQAKVTAAGGIAIEGRWRTSGGSTGTVYQRALMLTKVE